MSYRIALSKAGINALTATDPNDFIFNTDYNTFKIVAKGVASFSTVVTGTFTKNFAHGLSYTPSVDAFMMADSNAEVIRAGWEQFKTSPYHNVLFYQVLADSTNIIFTGRNFNVASVDLKFSYLIFETPL